MKRPRYTGKLIFCVCLSLMFFSEMSQAQSEQPKLEPGNQRLATPRTTLRNFLIWQNPPRVDMTIAAEAMQGDPTLTQNERERLARQLKRILDGRALYVRLESVPDSANHRDPITGHAEYVLFPDKLPQVYLVKQGSDWVFSRSTISEIPVLYRETYSEAAEYLVNLLPEFFHKQFFGVTLWQYTALFLLLLVGVFLRKIVEYGLQNYALRLTGKTKWQWDDLLLRNILKPVSFLVMVIFFIVFYTDLQFGVNVNLVINISLELMAAISVLWLIFKLVDVLADYLRSITEKTESKFDDQLIPLLRKTLKLFAFILGSIMVIQNYGYSVSSLIAGLGIGGLAMALAARDTLANLFGSVMIFLDRPFQIGDWIVSGGIEGTVEEVGFRSTRVRTFYNSLVSVPNSKLADSSIDNMGMRQFRRIKTTLGLTYSTTADQMHAFVEGIRAIIRANRFMRHDFYEIHFYEYGNFSLNVLVYCFLKVDSWSAELRERHNFLLEILRLAEKLGVEFAFPTQTVHIDSVYQDQPREVGKKMSESQMAEVITDFGPEGKLARPSGPVLTYNGKTIDFAPHTMAQRRGSGE